MTQASKVMLSATTAKNDWNTRHPEVVPQAQRPIRGLGQQFDEMCPKSSRAFYYINFYGKSLYCM